MAIQYFVDFPNVGLLHRAFLFTRSPALSWFPYSPVYDVFYVMTALGYYGTQYIPGIGRMATAVRLAFVDFVERSSTNGTAPRSF